MGNTEEKPKKKRWRRGKEMPLFSNSTWQELNDIWPQDVRVSSEIWKALSVLPVALNANKLFQRALLNGKELRGQDLYQLMWVMRCEEAKDNVATHFSRMKTRGDMTNQQLSIRNSTLVRLGLIEQIQDQHIRLYRVTTPGRMILKNLVDEMDKAHQNLREWVDSMPEEMQRKATKCLGRYLINQENP